MTKRRLIAQDQRPDTMAERQRETGDKLQERQEEERDKKI